jgi:hypothetical protein
MRQHSARPGATSAIIALLAAIGLLITGQLISSFQPARVELRLPPARAGAAGLVAETEAGMALLLLPHTDAAADATGGPCLADLAGGAEGAPRSLVMVGDANAPRAGDPADQTACAAGR